MRRVRTATVDLAFDEVGPSGGQPVLLLHGWPDAPRGWRQVAARLADAGHRVLLPANRGTGGTVFRDPDTIRDGSAPALAQDALDLLDALGVARVSVVGHDWGARVAYLLAATEPDRVQAIAALALGFQPHGTFEMPGFAQARRFWYQWLLFVDAGVAAVRADPAGFAREQWDTWSPPGWFDDAEFAATAAEFGPDWVAVTVSAYRHRFLGAERSAERGTSEAGPRPAGTERSVERGTSEAGPRPAGTALLDPRYDERRRRMAGTEQVRVPTLVLQGGDDRCDPPEMTEGLEGWFTDHRRVVLPGVGHFPHREDPERVATLVLEHLAAHPS